MLRIRNEAILLINIWISVFLLGSLQLAWAQEMPHPFAVATKSAALIDVIPDNSSMDKTLMSV